VKIHFLLNRTQRVYCPLLRIGGPFFVLYIFWATVSPNPFWHGLVLMILTTQNGGMFPVVWDEFR
jgi:hypothetical protein